MFDGYSVSVLIGNFLSCVCARVRVRLLGVGAGSCKCHISNCTYSNGCDNGSQMTHSGDICGCEAI